MALNLYRKLNETIARNCTRFLQNNAQKLAPVTKILEENTQSQKEAEKPNKFAVSSLYRTTPAENPRQWNNSFEPEREIMRRQLQNKYLQPATLPSYRDEPIFDNQFMATLQEGPIKKAQTIVMNNSASQQILENFKKRQAQNLPTRVPRLTSNPFPEPLKPTFSPYTLSDQEKAEQMFLDQQGVQIRPANSSRTTDFSATPGTMKTSKKFYCTSSRRENGQEVNGQFLTVGSLNFDADQVRCFSSKKRGEGGNEVCKDKSMKKANPCLPKVCNKITLKGCPPARKNTICKQKNKEVHCKKVEAPYPSYSESCYMEPRARQRECELCPWTEKNNPNFRGRLKKPPQFYHTLCPSSPITTNPTCGVLMKDVKDLKEHKNPAQMWMRKANLSQIYRNRKRMPTMDFFESAKTSKVFRWPFGATKDMDDAEECEVQSPIGHETIKLGYCDRHQTVLTEFFMKNEDLLRNYRNGDDLSDFGIKKAQLSKLLSSKELFDVVCKKGERIIPDYPKDCEKPYHDSTKTCPSGLTRKKTKKDRMKRKIPKDQSCS